MLVALVALGRGDTAGVLVYNSRQMANASREVIVSCIDPQRQLDVDNWPTRAYLPTFRPGIQTNVQGLYGLIVALILNTSVGEMVCGTV